MARIRSALSEFSKAVDRLKALQDHDPHSQLGRQLKEVEKRTGQLVALLKSMEGKPDAGKLMKLAQGFQDKVHEGAKASSSDSAYLNHLANEGNGVVDQVNEALTNW